jgi:glycosyltransferase involved in cell wall biosynthesis
MVHGYGVHFLVVGHGVQRQEVVDRLGPHVTLTGNLPHDELAQIYASADLLLFPSEAEVWPNVVMEARACGLPVVACEQGAAHVMRGEYRDGVLLPTRDPQVWVATTMDLLKQPGLLSAMGQRARCAVETQVPSWQGVLEEDLLPVWRRVARRSS